MYQAYSYKDELRIALASCLELEEPTIGTAWKVYSIPKGKWRRYHVPKLERMGLIRIEGERVYPLRTSQAFIYAYTDVEWEDCKSLSEEECKEIARQFLRNNKHHGLEDFLYS